MSIIEVQHLRKRYGDAFALRDVSLSIEEGEIFSILGPNGAGKTTLVESISGLREPDGGSISVSGLDPRRDRDRLRSLVGVQLQESALPNKLQVNEALELYASFYPHPADGERLLEMLGLGSKRTARYAQLSGGQKQRLSVALALIGRPRIAILDELTTGLDPQARREVWSLIEEVRASGVTVVLVTHFLEEAERLSDRLAVIDDGRVVALDTPARLASQQGGEQRVRFRPSVPLREDQLSSLPGVRIVERRGNELVVSGTGDLLGTVVSALAREHIVAQQLRVDQAEPRGRLRRPHQPRIRFRPSIGAGMSAISTSTLSRSPFAQLLRTEAKLWLREPTALFWGVVFPLILTLVFGLASNKPQHDLGGLRLIDVYVPTLMAFVLTIVAVSALPSMLAAYRNIGVLRRMSTTPVAPWLLLGADVIVNAVIIVSALVLIGGVSVVAFNVSLPGPFPGFVLALVLGAVAMLALGATVAALAANERVAQILGTLLFFPMMFFAGLWVPQQQMGHTLREVSHYTPLGALVAALQDSLRGTWPGMVHLAVLAVYAIVFGALAAKLFRWE